MCGRLVLSIDSRTTDSRDVAKSAELLLLCKPHLAACALKVDNQCRF
jgi:hypothetical protein